MDKLSNVRRAEEGGPVSTLKMSDDLKASELVSILGERVAEVYSFLSQEQLLHQLRLFQATQGVINLNV